MTFLFYENYGVFFLNLPATKTNGAFIKFQTFLPKFFNTDTKPLAFLPDGFGVGLGTFFAFPKSLPKPNFLKPKTARVIAPAAARTPKTRFFQLGFTTRIFKLYAIRKQ